MEAERLELTVAILIPNPSGTQKSKRFRQMHLSYSHLKHCYISEAHRGHSPKGRCMQTHRCCTFACMYISTHKFWSYYWRKNVASFPGGRSWKNSKSWNHRIAQVGTNLKDHQVQLQSVCGFTLCLHFHNLGMFPCVLWYNHTTGFSRWVFYDCFGGTNKDKNTETKTTDKRYDIIQTVDDRRQLNSNWESTGTVKAIR